MNFKTAGLAAALLFFAGEAAAGPILHVETGPGMTTLSAAAGKIALDYEQNRLTLCRPQTGCESRPLDFSDRDRTFRAQLEVFADWRVTRRASAPGGTANVLYGERALRTLRVTSPHFSVYGIDLDPGEFTYEVAATADLSAIAAVAAENRRRFSPPAVWYRLDPALLSAEIGGVPVTATLDATVILEYEQKSAAEQRAALHNRQ